MQAASGPMPLSLAQERMWFHEQLSPPSARYNSPVLLHIRGSIDVARLQAALDALVGTHEQLRTRIAAPDGIPRQAVLDEAGPCLEVRRPRSGRTLADCLPEIQRESRERFDLASQPPLRARLWPLAEHESVLALTFHHLVVDAESLRVVLGQLGDWYAAGPGGPVEVDARYRQFVAEERAQAQGDRVQQALAERAEALAGIVEPMLPRPTGDGSADAASQGWNVAPFSQALSSLVAARARSLGLTPFMLLLGVLAIQLASYTSQSEFLLTTLVSRRRRRFRGVVGFFVDTEVLVADLRGADTPAAVFERCRVEILRAVAGPPIPLQLLVERMRHQDGRDWPSRLRLLASYEGHAPSFLWGDLEVSRCTESAFTEPVFDCQVGWWDSGAGMGMTVAYDPRAVRPDAVEQIVEEHLAILPEVLEAPDQPLTQIATGRSWPSP